MHPTLPTVLLVALSALALTAGCGSDEGPASAGAAGDLTATTLGKAAYVKQANAICAQHRHDRYAATTVYLKRQEDASPDERITGALTHVYIPTMEAQLEDLRALGAPRGDEQQIEAMLGAYEQAVDGARELEGASSTAALDSEFEKAGRLARDYGLTECTYG